MTYKLLDSGSFGRLEQFGEAVLARPSSVAVWDRRLPNKEWDDATASYSLREERGGARGGKAPDGGTHDAKGVWTFSRQKITEWHAKIGGVLLHLELQSNGQIGVFPEHATYLDRLEDSITHKMKFGPVKVLNLFAYTGMASLRAALSGAHVTHVDSSKRAIQWAKRNCELNGLSSSEVRFIEEDVSKYLAREARRGSEYDIIIADPPSFSRVSKTVSWTLESVLRDLVQDCVRVLSKERGAIFMTNHSSVYTNDIVCNLLLDHLKSRACRFVKESLALPEEQGRVYPAGSLVWAEYE